MGRKKALQAGLALFGLGSLAAALSTSTEMLIATRAFMGIGAAERPRAVRWSKGAEILFTWFVTLPAAALLAAVTYMIVARIVA